jgi:16S rRNA (guanine527-N7)-methyltransferase
LEILNEIEIERMLSPKLLYSLPKNAYVQLARYLQLLSRWNSRMNLTSVRDPAVLVGLHIAECLRCAQLIPDQARSVLDFGSGAGLPGIPIQIARPELTVMLAESQVKKASFLREAARELALLNTSVYSGRVADLPHSEMFDVVAMRAVDRMEAALRAAHPRIGSKGVCMVLTTEAQAESAKNALPDLEWKTEPIPGTRQRVLLVGSKEA